VLGGPRVEEALLIPIRFCVGYFGGKPGKKWFDPRAWKEFASCCGVNLAGAACGRPRRLASAVGLGGWPRRSASAAGLGGRPRRLASAAGLSGRPRRSASAAGLGGWPRRLASAVGLGGWPRRSASAAGLGGRPRRLASAAGLGGWPRRSASAAGLGGWPRRLASASGGLMVLGFVRRLLREIYMWLVVVSESREEDDLLRPVDVFVRIVTQITRPARSRMGSIRILPSGPVDSPLTEGAPGALQTGG